MFRVVAVEIFYLPFMCFGIAIGSKCYSAEFSDDVWPCPDYDNKVLQCDPLQVGMVEGKEAELGLNGQIKVSEAIEEGVLMVVEIYKILDIGKEFMYRLQGDICASIKDKDTPWYPMVESMKITKCPIDPKTYDIKDMIMDLNSTKEVMSHEMCGDYAIQLEIFKRIEKTYNIKDMRMDLNSTKEVMSHEMCGDYAIQLEMMKELELSLSCWELAVTLSEYDCN